MNAPLLKLTGIAKRIQEQRPNRSVHCRFAVTVSAGQARDRAKDARYRIRDVERRADGIIQKDRLFDEQDIAGPRKAREQLLRSLPDEIPAQM